MKRQSTIRRMAATGMLAATLVVFPGAMALAHCDSTRGPVIPEAVAALDSADATPLLKWVSGESEAEIRAAFDEAQIVRAKGPEAQQLADRYFLETLVRLHRAGEGAPYTGITDAPVEPIIAMADKALADDSVEEMIRRINRHVAQSIQEKFQRASEAREHKDDSVEAGREFVAAYVSYVHYVEGIHAAIVSAGGHQH